MSGCFLQRTARYFSFYREPVRVIKIMAARRIEMLIECIVISRARQCAIAGWTVHYCPLALRTIRSILFPFRNWFSLARRTPAFSLRARQRFFRAKKSRQTPRIWEYFDVRIIRTERGWKIWHWRIFFILAYFNSFSNSFEICLYIYIYYSKISRSNRDHVSRYMRCTGRIWQQK